MTSRPSKPGLLAGAVLASALALTGCNKDDLPADGTKIGGIVVGTERKVADIVAPHVDAAESRLAEAVEKFASGSHATLDAAEKRLDASNLEKSCANLNAQERLELAKLGHEALGTVLEACGPAVFKYNGMVEIGKLDDMSIAEMRARVAGVKVSYSWSEAKDQMTEKTFENFAPQLVVSVSAIMLVAFLGAGYFKSRKKD